MNLPIHLNLQIQFCYDVIENTYNEIYQGIKLNIGVVNFYFVNVNCESQGIKVSLKTV